MATQNKKDTSAGAKRSEQILAATIDEITRRGISGATIGVIASSLKISKGVVTCHFPSREQLLLETVDSIYTSACAAMHSAAEQSETQAALCEYVESNLRWITENPGQVGALVALRTSGRPGVREHCAQLEVRANSELSSIFAALAEGNTESAVQPASAAGAKALALRGAIDAYSIAARRSALLDPITYSHMLIEIFNPKDSRVSITEED